MPGWDPSEYADSLAGRLSDLRHYAALLASVAAVGREGTIRVPE